MIIDVHNHIGISPHSKHPAEELIREMDAAGVDISVACTIWLRGKVDNDYVYNEAKKYPRRIVPFAFVNPCHLSDAVTELKRCVEKLGMRGLKLHPFLNGYALDDHVIVDQIFEACSRLKIPILAHGAGDNPHTMPHQFEEVAKTFPEVTLIMAHMGTPWAVNDAVMIAKRNDNILIDTSGVGINDLRMAVGKAGAEKFLMASDTPYGDFQISLKIIEKAVPDVEERKLITGGNCQRILGIK